MYTKTEARPVWKIVVPSLFYTLECWALNKRDTFKQQNWGSSGVRRALGELVNVRVLETTVREEINTIFFYILSNTATKRIGSQQIW